MPVPGCLVGGRVLAAGSDSAAVMVIGGPTVAGVCDESMEYSGTAKLTSYHSRVLVAF